MLSEVRPARYADMNDRTLRHKVAIVGVGETQYYKHGQSPDPEFKLALKAIVAACASAGISPHEIDGFASYSDDRNDAVRLAAALGIRNCGTRACNGAAAAGVQRQQSPMPPPRLPAGLRIASWYFARWLKGSSFVTGRAGWRSTTAVRPP